MVHTVLDVQSTDDDGDTEGSGLTYAFSTETGGGVDNSLFAIDADTGVITFLTSPDFENANDDDTNNDYEVQVTVTDSGSLTAIQNITITVTNTLDPPVITSQATVNFTENATGTVIDVQSTNTEGDTEGSGSTYTFSTDLGGGVDNALFAIDANTGVITFSNSPDYETPEDNDSNNDYEIQVTVTDSGSLTAVQDITITVTDVLDNLPVFTAPNTGFDVASASYTSNSFSVSSQLSSPYTIAFNKDGSKMFVGGIFSSEIDEYTLSTPYDLSTASYSQVYTASEGTSYYDVTFNESGTKMYLLAYNNKSIYEYSLSTAFDVSTSVYTNKTYPITEHYSPMELDFNSDGSQLFVISIGGEILVYDLSTPYDLSTLSYNSIGFDTGTEEANSYGLAFSTDGSKFFVIGYKKNVYEYHMLSTIEYAENGTTAVSDIDANNGDGGFTDVGITFSLASGGDNDLFAIDNSTGVLTFVSSPDYEVPTDANTDNSYEITVIATDINGSSNKNINITVTDMADATPVITSSSSANFAENVTGTVLDVQSTDADGDTEGSGLTYAFSTETGGGVDNALFAIDANTGIITFLASPDFENANDDDDTNNDYDIQVTVTDSGSLTAIQDITITITDLTETVAFTIDAISDTNINENTAYTSVTPALSGATPIGAVTYTLGGNDATDFTINPSTGVVSMIARDYENAADADTNNIYELTITATDSDGNSDSESWTVTVDDDYGAEVLAQIGLKGDNPNAINSIVTIVQLNTITGLTEVVLANETDYQDYIDANPDNFSSPATLEEVQAMVNTVNALLGNKVFENFSFNMYPNPASSMIYLTFSKSDSSSANINIYNTIGQSVLVIKKEIRNNKVSLDVSSLPSGTYFLNINNETQVISKKLVIN
ncbi:T9SS type A sorting domain-containing protein [Tenacibaculum sp.]|uniref:T9SS type A sorting domain-containing protein n=1 Tax=Tenacibaculum sp. TaxID=1906242 RepID=UPI003D0C5C20